MSPSNTIVITGGNAGLGFAIAKEIVRDPSRTVVIACRNPGLGHEAVAKLWALGANAIFLPLDLGAQASVHRFVELFREAALPPLHGIVCNAGMMNAAMPEKTKEGYETTFAVNHLGHFLLVRLLLDDLKLDGRITFISSGTHDPAAKTRIPPPVYTNAEALAHDFTATRQDGMRRYATSKLCNVLCTYELQRLLNESGDPRLASIKVNAINPGLMPGTGFARTMPKPMRLISRYVLPLISKDVQTPEISGKRVAELTIGAESAPGGRYFSNGKPTASSDASYVPALQRELWVSSEKMTGLVLKPLDNSPEYYTAAERELG